MKRLLTVLSLVISGSYASIEQRDVIAIGSLGLCPKIAIQLQPVVYCEYLQSATVVDPFRNQRPVTISVAPTSFCTSDILTATIYPDSDFPRTSSATTTTSSTLSSATATVPSLPDLFIGQGLSSGSVTGLPDGQFLFIAFTSATGGVRKRRNQVARQSRDDSVQVLGLVNLDPALAGGYTQDECDRSSPLIFQAGTLVQNAQTVAKAPGQNIAPLGLLDDPTGGINVTFTLTDGFFAWNTPDLGEATFHDCSGSFFAAFGTSPAGCSPIRIGAINGLACRERVSQTREPNPLFVAPLAATQSPVSSLSSNPSVTISSDTAPLTTDPSSLDALPRTTSISQSSTLDRTASASSPSTVVSQTSVTTTAEDSPSSPLPYSTFSTPAVSPTPGLNDCESLSSTYTSPKENVWDIFCSTFLVSRFDQRRYAASLQDCILLADENPTYDAVTYVASLSECTLHYNFKTMLNGGVMQPADSADTSAAIVRTRGSHSSSTSAI